MLHYSILKSTHTNVVQIGRNVDVDLDYPGDVRVVYTLYNTTEGSALAKQTASTFAPWEGPYDKSYTMFMVEDGMRSAYEMLRDAEAQNAACEALQKNAQCNLFQTPEQIHTVGWHLRLKNIICVYLS